MHEMQTIVIDVRGVCLSVSQSVCLCYAAKFGGACSVCGVMCSLCQITLASCFFLLFTPMQQDVGKAEVYHIVNLSEPVQFIIGLFLSLAGVKKPGGDN